MKKSELVAAVKEINELIEPPIDTKLGVDELEAELLEASEALSEEDGLSKKTMGVLNQIKEKYAEEDDEDAGEDEDEDIDEIDEEDEGVDEEDENGDEIFEDEASEIDEDVEEDEEEEEPAPKKPSKRAGSKKAEKAAKAELVEDEDDEEPAPKKSKADKPKKSKDDIFGGNKTVTRIEYFIDLINEGRYSRKDLVELAVKKFPDATVAALTTVLSDGCNPKYCRFPVLLRIDKEDGGIVKFTDIKCERSKVTKELVRHEKPKKPDTSPSKKEEKPDKKKAAPVEDVEEVEAPKKDKKKSSKKK